MTEKKVSQGISKREIYTPRVGKANSGIDKFPEELKKYVLSELEPLLKIFGYIGPLDSN